MTFHFAPAVRESVSLLIALAGASGSGKTFSALRLAKGMAPSGKIAFIDTEARRGLHYAEEFSFLHSDMRPPFRPENFIEGIRAAEAAGAEVVIIDSFSHEYDGQGGIMDWADEIEAGTPKPGVEHPRTAASRDQDWWKDWIAKPVPSPGNWKMPKGAHKKLMNALLQCRASIIFCLRADEKIRIGKDERGKTIVEPLGWMPICEKRFMFEMTASFTLTPDKPGIPHFDLPHKLQRQHRGMFTDNQPISEESGRLLAEWAAGGTAAPVRHPPAGAAEEFKTTDVIPTAAEYHAQWAQHILNATSAKSLGERWANEKDMRRQVEWTEEHPLNPVKKKVEAALESLRAPV